MLVKGLEARGQVGADVDGVVVVPPQARVVGAVDVVVVVREAGKFLSFW